MATLRISGIAQSLNVPELAEEHLEVLRSLIERARKAKASETAAKAAILIGDRMVKDERHAEAQIYFEEAVEIFTELDRKSDWTTLQAAWGLIYVLIEQEKFDDAMRYLEVFHPVTRPVSPPAQNKTPRSRRFTTVGFKLRQTGFGSATAGLWLPSDTSCSML